MGRTNPYNNSKNSKAPANENSNVTSNSANQSRSRTRNDKLLNKKRKSENKNDFVINDQEAFEVYQRFYAEDNSVNQNDIASIKEQEDEVFIKNEDHNCSGEFCLLNSDKKSKVRKQLNNIYSDSDEEEVPEDVQIVQDLYWKKIAIRNNVIPKENWVGYFTEVPFVCSSYLCTAQPTHGNHGGLLYCREHYEQSGQRFDPIHLCKYCDSCNKCFFWEAEWKFNILKLKECPILSHEGKSRELSDPFWIKQDLKKENIPEEYAKKLSNSWWAKRSHQINMKDLRSKEFYRRLSLLSNKNHFNEQFALNYSKFKIECSRQYGGCSNYEKINFYQQGVAFRTCFRCKAHTCIDCCDTEICPNCEGIGMLPSKNFTCAFCQYSIEPKDLINHNTTICTASGCKSTLCNACVINHAAQITGNCPTCRRPNTLTSFRTLDKLYDFTDEQRRGKLGLIEDFEELYEELFKLD